MAVLLSSAKIFNKKYFLFLIIKFVIAGGLLFYILTEINPDKLIKEIEKSDKIFLLFAVILLPFNILLQYLKWRLTSGYFLDERENKKIIQSLFLGFSAAVFTPARIGEYFGRAAVFRDKPILQVTIATLLDKFFPLLCVAFFGSIAGVLFIHYYLDVTLYLTVSLFLVLFILFYFFMMLLMNIKYWDNILFKKIERSQRLGKIVSRLAILKNLDRVYILKMTTISILFYICFIVQYSFLVSAFSHKFNFMEYQWAGNLIMFAKTIIPAISFGELGIREGASIYFLSKFGEPDYVGFNASIFLFIINVLTPAAAGFFFLFRKNND